MDNAPLIELFELSKVGLWALLTEECMIPKGSDAGFCEKVSQVEVRGRINGYATSMYSSERRTQTDLSPTLFVPCQSPLLSPKSGGEESRCA